MTEYIIQIFRLSDSKIVLKVGTSISKYVESAAIAPTPPFYNIPAISCRITVFSQNIILHSNIQS